MKPVCNTGRCDPLGATIVDGGVNFSVFSRSASAMELLFFDHEDDARPSRVIPIDPSANRTYHYWHVFVPGVKPGQTYGYRADGPFEPANGMRFDPFKVLLDPYGRGVVVPKHYSRDAARAEGDNTATAMKSVVIDSGTYDWEGDTPLRRPSARTVIYEMHVRGLTRHPNSGVPEKTRGTFAGLIEKIPYLQQLGITAVELLPVFQFDTQDVPPGLINYWGYQPVSFFAPHQAHSSRQDPLGPVDEFRDMVKALHRAGIEVILDVVFNHTSEGDHAGPTLSFRGLDNTAYYILQQDRSRYADYSGCGNMLNANHPIVRRMIVDSLRYWVKQMHVDGGTVMQVFLYPASLKVKEVSEAAGIQRDRRVYIIRNARFEPDWVETPRRALSIAGRAVSSLIATQGIGDLYRTYLNAQRDGIDYNLVAIPNDFRLQPREAFDREYMQKLFDVGFEMGKKGGFWRKVPPAFDGESPG